MINNSNKKNILHGQDARVKIKRGIDILTDTVKGTLGPKGKTVIMEDMDGFPYITKDGVTVAGAIRLKDPFEDMGALVARDVASRTNVKAGDGTTSATVLAQAIVEKGNKYILAGANPTDVKRGIDLAVLKCIECFQKHSKKIKDDSKEIREVGIISSNGDEELGTLIALAMKEITHEGVITVEESNFGQTSIDIVKGMQIEKGYITSDFVMNKQKMETELENVVIIIANEKIYRSEELLPFYKQAKEENKSILLICEELENEALASLALNVSRGNLKACAIKSPGGGPRKADMLQDIATITGGIVIDPTHGVSFDSLSMYDLGYAEKVIIRKNETIIVNGNGNQDDISERIEIIREQIKVADSNFEKNRLRGRLSRLKSGVAVLRIGGYSEVERKERKDRAIDAVNATRAAVEEGIVPGGGLAFLWAKKFISDFEYLDNKDINLGIQIIRDILSEITRTIVNNMGINGDIIVDMIEKSMKKDIYTWHGYDARSEKMSDLKKSGVVDPAKVCRVALENAASIAGTFLTTNSVIVSDNIKTKENETI